MHDDPSSRNAPPDAKALAARHEIADIRLGGIGGLAIALAIMIVLVFIVCGLLTRALLKHDAQEEFPASPFAGVNQPIAPAPQLQPSINHNTLDRLDLKTLRAQEDGVLNSYAWIGDDKHAARIPIQRAMDLLLQRGLPTRDTAPAATQSLGGRP